MSQIWRAVLIALMLFGFVVLLVGLSTPAFAVMPSQTFASQLPAESTPSGEFCGGDTGFPCSTPAQSTPVQAASTPQPGTDKGYYQGLIEGEAAGKADTGGLNAECPGSKGSEYCKGWDAGYAKGKQQQRGSGILRNGIFTGVAIAAALLAVVTAVASSTVAAAGQSGLSARKGILRGAAAVATIVAIIAAAAALYPPLAAAILTLL